MATNDLDYIVAERSGKFLITGIGASAGGIQALKEFFKHVPQNSGIAYVVILHLSPNHDSQLAQVLQVVSQIPVLQVKEKTKIESNHIYVVPPNQHLIIEDGFIAPSINTRVEDRRAPVDIFFRNLADTHGSRAVCVVLSGMGADGSMGLKRIKEMGGVVFVQSPREAEFNEMPRNSIATDLVDEVLPVAEIPAKIIAYKNSLGTVQISIEHEKRAEPDQHAINEIFTQLRVHTGHDFSNYKRPTLLRRIERRIYIRNLPDLPSYVHFMSQNPDEVNALLKDLLISVTNFFRDAKPFGQIEQDVLPAILKGKKSNDEIRIWVAGCATGEEAYSIAMLVAEKMIGVIDAPKVQIFATDIDEGAIAIAREGYYTLNDAADVTPEQLRRFFTVEGDGYRIRREIREMVLFANHNFLKDPPFSRLDMITCRNVLIYLNSVAQERVMETFHFALNPGSYLFLGTSESVDGASDLYATFNRENHIYQAREVGARPFPVPIAVPRFQFMKTEQFQKPDEKESHLSNRMSLGELHQKLLEQYAPPSVVVNEEYEIVHMSEKAGRYLEFAGGEPTLNLLKLIKPEIRLELRSALYQAVQHKTAVEARDIKLAVNGEPQLLDINVRPVLNDGDSSKGFILILFEQKEGGENEATVMLSDEPVAKQLEEELNYSKSQLRKSHEQHEYQAEELKASNEELQAMNEELRSAAEELETSREELQSINEELRTVNQELKVKIEEISVTTNNLQNLINSADVGTIFLDRSLSIRMFTPAVLEVFNLKSSDLGRPITDITNKLNYKELLQDAETVLEKLAIVEREVVTTDSRAFVMRILPYRTSDDRISGVVVTFFDITSRKQIENALRRSEEHRRLLIESAKDYAIFTLDAERRVVSWSSGAETMMGYSEREIVGKTGDIIFTPEDLKEEAPTTEAERAVKEGRAENERWHLRKDGSRFWGSGSVSQLKDDEGKLIGFVKILRDLTETRQLEEAKFFLASIVETSNDSIITINFQRTITSWNKAAEDLYGYTAAEAIGKNLSMLTLPEDFVAILNKVDAVKHNREVVVFDCVRHKKGGELIDLEIVMSPVLNGSGEVIGVSTIARDISERKRREANLAFLAEINLDLAPLLTVHDVMDPVGERLADYLKLSRCQFSVVDEEEDCIEVVYEYRRDKSMPSLIGVSHISDSITPEDRRHYSAGKLAVLNSATDLSMLNTGVHQLKQFSDGSVVNMPHLEGGRWRFLLTIESDEVRAWRSEDLELLRELSSKLYIRIQRARAEEALRKSEERLQVAIKIAKTVVWEWNVPENKIETTENFPEVYGYSTIEFAQQGYDLLHADDRETHLQKVQAATQGGGYHSRFRVIRPDTKEIVWLEEHADSIHDENGKVIKLVGAAIDITELKKIEEELRESATRFRTLANVVLQVIWTNTEDGIADYFNQRWYEYSGLSYDQSKGLGWQVIVHPEDATASVEKWQKALASGDVFDIEYRLRQHDGSYRWFIGRNVPLKNDSGNVIGWFGTATDIENLKKTEEALSQSEARLRITMESATDYAIITMDTDRRVEKWSEGATQLFGYSEAEMRSKLVDIIFTEEDRKSGVPQKEMETARDTGRAADERWHQRKNGSSFYVNGVVRPIQNGKLTGYVKIMRDMTQQQLFTEELHRLVAERTRELEHSNEDLRQFATIASHDLQEPLRKLKFFAAILQKFEKELPSEGKELLKKISSTSERMSQLIREVLQFSKIAYGEKVFAPTDLNQILQNVLNDLDMLLNETGTTVKYDNNLPEIEAAHPQMNQLFYNLLTNSIKFRRDDVKPIIHITVAPVSKESLMSYPNLLPEKSYVEIVVSDNGIGFEQQYADQIFHIFERLHSTDEYEGTGVGLAHCKKVVENHSGHIYAVSSEGDGAAFHVLLPIKQ